MIETTRRKLPPNRHRLRSTGGGAVAIVLLLLSLMLAACGNGYGGGSSGGGGGGGPTLSITEPADGASVTVPFTVTVTSSEELGTTGSGKHHVHIYFDDNQSDYLVVESDTVKIMDAPAGQHVMHVSLRHANHSAAGAEAQVRLNITTGGPTGPSQSPSGSGGSPDYGY